MPLRSIGLRGGGRIRRAGALQAMVLVGVFAIATMKERLPQ